MLPPFYHRRQTKELIHEIVGCMGKISYPSEDVAWRVFLTYYFPFGKQGKSTREQLRKLSCYRCKFCGSWHIGSRKSRKSSKKS